LWKAYDSREHRREVSDDYQSAKLCNLIVNMFRSSESAPVELSDFLLYERPMRKGQTAEEMLAIVGLLTDAYGGKRVLN
jgi:hypothetical protein